MTNYDFNGGTLAPLRAVDGSVTLVSTTGLAVGGSSSSANCIKLATVDNSTATVELVLDASFAGGQVGFNWAASTETDFDFGRFYVDGSEVPAVPAISGEGTWDIKTVTLTSGAHILRWRFIKDGAVGNFDDAVYITNVMVPSITGASFTSKNDKLMDSLTKAGYSSGALADRERLRLIAATNPSKPSSLSLHDLYSLAGERPRL